MAEQKATAGQTVPVEQVWSTNDAGQQVSFVAPGNAASELALQLKPYHAMAGGRIVLVTAPSQRSRDLGSRIASEVIASTGAASPSPWILAASCALAAEHVPEANVVKATAMIQQHLPCILLAVGGGSTVGLAKGIVGKHLGFAGEVPRIVSVPTSYSGSESTNIWGVSEDGKGKVVRRDVRVRPVVTVYDPALLLSLPRAVTVKSAWNACAHAVGALSADRVPPVVHRKAEDGITSIVHGLRRVLDQDDSDAGGVSIEAVYKLQYGAYLCGSVLNECPMGMHHKLAHILGGSYGLAHADVHTVLLPFTIHYNSGHAARMNVAVGRSLGDTRNPAGAVWDLQKRLGAPTNLRAIGFALDKVEEAAAAAEAHAHKSGYSNPRPVTREDIASLLSFAHHGRRPSPRTRLHTFDGLDGPHAALPVASMGAPLHQAKLAVVCVHGRFASAERILQMFEEATGTFHASGNVALFAPQAANSNWYPGSFLANRAENEPHFGHTMRLIHRCVQHAAEQVGGPANVIIFGFSQGACAAVSYAAGPLAPALGGLVVISGGLCGSEAEVRSEYESPNLSGVPCILGCAKKDGHVPAGRFEATAAVLRGLGAKVHAQLFPGSAHRINEATASRARNLVLEAAARRAGSDPRDPYQYLAGYEAALQSEAIPDTVPRNQRAPRFVAHNLVAECINGSPFCAPRGGNLSTWFYRIHPSIGSHGAFARQEQDSLKGDFCCPGASLTPEPVRWFTPPEPKTLEEQRDFVDSLVTLAGTGNPMSVKGLAIHKYGCNKDMVDRSFYNSDGDLLVIPELGALRIQTELGYLHVAPGEIFILPRGLKMTVTLPDGQGRGFVGELFESTHFQLPNLGPLGSNGLASARHFKVPTAAYEDRACADYELVSKLGGNLFRAHLQHSPYDVVGWSGNYHPCKYDLMQFMAFGSVTWDHGDPSLHTVLTCPINPQNNASAFDFVCFRPRWDAVLHTWRPPYWHRNMATEFNAIVKINNPYSGFDQGVHWLTPCMTAHGISAASHNGFGGSPSDDEPRRISEDSIWIMIESIYPMSLMDQAANSPTRDRNYRDFFAGIERPFNPPAASSTPPKKRKSERMISPDQSPLPPRFSISYCRMHLLIYDPSVVFCLK